MVLLSASLGWAIGDCRGWGWVRQVNGGGVQLLALWGERGQKQNCPFGIRHRVNPDVEATEGMVDKKGSHCSSGFYLAARGFPI